MVREGRSKNLLSHKSLLILIKYIPHIIAIAYAIYTFLGIFGIDYNVFGCFFHVSFLTWIILYCLSIVFKYCYVHRLPIYYIGANELITCLDYYLDIELDYFTFITISLLMSCILIFGYTYYYINKLKMRDKKKFYVPKHIKNPLPGDYEVTLNWGDKVYVEKNEFEKKTSKFFKNYLVVEDNLEDNHDYSQNYLTFKALEDGTFQFTNAINYSVDGGTTWTALAADTATPTITSGKKIMWKAELIPSSSGIGKFSSTGNFNVEGNPMSLLYVDNFIGQTDLTGKDYAFYRLFYNCSKLINAKNLSLLATTLVSWCYSGMFRGCTNLTTAPQLLATTLAYCCYSYMFYGCTSLTIAPQLPATTLENACYDNMFADCTALTTAPELPATKITSGCYKAMFNGCTSLTTAPELPATKLLTTCYQYMFSGCTSLNYIKAMFTTEPNTSYTNNWVKNVAASGTFVKNSEAIWDVTGTYGVPTGWTVIEA